MRSLVALVVIACVGCATAPAPVVKTVTVEVPVPVVQKVPEALTADCPPPALDGTTVGGALDRLAGVEAALAACRSELAKIRSLP